MNEKELIQLLNRVKTAPEMGGDPTGERARRSWLRICDANGWDAARASSFHWTPGVWMDYVLWRFSQTVVQPAAVAVGVLFLSFGGWSTVANAAHSIPGDVLYPVKLASEQMRLRFATTPAQRATLHVEYAGRRVQELTELTQSKTSQAGDERVKQTVAQFAMQIASVNEDLAAVQSADPQAAAMLATLVDEKTSQYESALEQSRTQGSSAVTDDVASAIKTAEDASSQARDALVDSHESTGEEQTAYSIKRSFQKQYDAIRTRIALNLGRLAVIESHLIEEEGGTREQREQIDEARNAVSFHEKRLRDAMDFLVYGGYRRALDLLNEVDLQVRESEGIITALEIEISRASTPGTDPSSFESGS